MRRAAVSGLLTMIATALGIWAVYQNVRLDWPETALVASAGLFVAGFMTFARLMEGIGKEDEEDAD